MSDGEPQKDCPLCGKTVHAKGLHTHVMQSSDEIHGKFREVPEGFDSSSVKTVNKKSTVDFKQSKSSGTSRKRLYLCNWCNEILKGERGYKIHVSKCSGDVLHPDDASIEDQQYSTIACDDDYNPLMDMEDVYRIQRRESRGGIGAGSQYRPIDDFSDQVDEQIAALLSNQPKLEDQKQRVMSILDCSEEEFEQGLKLYQDYSDYSGK